MKGPDEASHKDDYARDKDNWPHPRRNVGVGQKPVEVISPVDIAAAHSNGGGETVRRGMANP